MLDDPRQDPAAFSPFEEEPEEEGTERDPNSRDLFDDDRDEEQQYRDALDSSRQLRDEQEAGPVEGEADDAVQREEPEQASGDEGKLSRRRAEQGLFTARVPVYEGPMDLLLYVVRQRHVDLIELPLSDIATDFLDYASAVQDVDLDAAGEVIYIAAILLRMKVRALLPVEEEEQIEDPEVVAERDEQLEEVYREIVAAARQLARGEEVQRKHFRRGEAGGKPEMDTTDELMRNVSIVHLAEAFREVTRRMEKSRSEQLRLFRVTVEDQSKMIRRALERDGKIAFTEIVENMTERIEAIVAFLAVLAMIRASYIRVAQEGLFGTIWITKGPRFDVEDDEALIEDEWAGARADEDQAEENSRS